MNIRNSHQLLVVEATTEETTEAYIKRCVATAEASGCLVEAAHAGRTFRVAPSHVDQVWVAYHAADVEASSE